MTDSGSDRGGWDATTSEWWQREFTAGADVEYTDQILPLVASELEPFTAILDVGAGEGQVARMLAHRGADVVGVDPIPTQLNTAVERGGGPRYVRATAAALPFSDHSFEAAVACLVFEHIDDADDAIAEVARVLTPGGTFLFLLNHPLLQTPNSGWIDDRVVDPPEQYWRIGPYLVEQDTIEEVQKGVFIRFVHRPLSRYINALSQAGLTVTRMFEPAPPPGFVAAAPEFFQTETIPRLLALRCTRV